MSDSYYIPFRGSRLHYLRWGMGEEWLFCFHGYGEDASSFNFLEPVLGKRFTIIAIDMPLHGKTEWNKGLLFKPEELIGIIDTIKPADAPIHILGYSMGGRVALQLLEMIPQEIRKMILIAPDGLHKNWWQWFSTQTMIGNRLFRFTMKHRSLMNVLISLGGKLRLYDISVLRFVHFYFDDASQRSILYRRWTTMRQFNPSIKRQRKSILENKIPTHLIFGKYDRVILTKHGRTLRKNAEKHITVTEIKAGHQLLKEKYLPQLINFF